MILRIIRRYTFDVKVISLLLLFVSSSLICFPQLPKTVNIKDIPQRKVRRYIVSRDIDQMQDFSLIHASWKKDIAESDFNVIEETFYLNHFLSEVWDCYRHADPYKMWNGRSVRFGLLITKSSNSVIYAKDVFFPEADTGQIYFLNLRLIKGLFKVPVAFEIITIDQKREMMEFSYIDNNKSLGKQTIQFFENGDGNTRIVHRSYYRSNSSLRDKIFYPYFHKKFVEEFHKNMRVLVNSSKLSLSNY